jgi:hypothetical protein
MNQVRVTYSQQRGILRRCIFFHPDFHRRLWFFTKSADLFLEEKALAGSLTFYSKNTAGRELHPALKIIMCER